MKIKLKTIVLISIIVLINLISTIVFAEENNYSAQMSLTSESKLNAGDTVTVSLNLTNINAGDGLDTIQAKIDYDTDVFEVLTTSNFVSVNSWNPSFVSSSNKLTFIKSNGIRASEPEAVVTLNLKVKSAINVDSTKITFSDIIVSGGLPNMGGTGDIKVNSISITIKKDENASGSTDNNIGNTNDDNINNGNTNDNNINNGNTNNTNTNTNKIANTNVKKDNTVTKTSKLPKAGIGQYGIGAIIVVFAIAIGSYVLYKKYEKNIK